jgi:hypothetical protein
VVATLLVVTSACQLVPSGFEVVVSNRSSAPVVVAVSIAFDTDAVQRFHASAAGSDVIVDTVGEANPATPWVIIFDRSCAQLFEIQRDFSEGATIILGDGQAPEVESGRHVSRPPPPADLRAGDDTCEAAAARL